MEQQFNDDRAIQYLLGQLSAQEQEQFEERYFTDDTFMENFLAVKDELIDLYARGELSGDRLQQFDKHFLASPERRQRVEGAKQFIAAISQKAASSEMAVPSTYNREPLGRWSNLASSLRFRSPILQFSVAVLVVIALGLGVWWWMARSRRERLAAESQTQQQRPVVQPTTQPSVQANASPTRAPEQIETPGLEQTLPSPKPSTEEAKQRPTPRSTPIRTQPQRGETGIASIVLTPVLTRNSGESPAVVVTQETTTVRLSLTFKNSDYQSYIAVVRTVEGDDIRTVRGLKALKSKSGSQVSLDLPAARLTRSDYVVTLSGVNASGSVEVIGDYYLNVERRASKPPAP